MYRDLHHTLQPHLVIYSQDGFGLGHMRRTCTIAAQFLKAIPGASVLTLSDSQLGQFFGTAPNHDYLKLPSIVKDGPGNWRASKLPLSFSNVQAMRQELIRSAVVSFWPDILLVDHMPHGAMGELIPALEALKSVGAGTKIVLGMRDILDAPETVIRRWQAEGAFEVLERYYDRILVYGMPGVYDVARQYQFPPAVARLVEYCGYVCTPAAARYATRARQQSLSGAPAGARLIVAEAGGGADAYPLMSRLVDAMPAILEHQPCALVMIAGPFMPADLRHDLETRAAGLPIRVRASVSDTLSYVNAADLVVAMAGYNTTMEILRSGKRAILVPRAGPSREQRTRASLFAGQNWVDTLDPDELSAPRLAEKVLANLNAPAALPLHADPDLEGAYTATARLLAMLSPENIRPTIPLPGLKELRHELPL